MAMLMKKSDIIQFPYHFLIYYEDAWVGIWNCKTFFSEIGIEGSLKFLDRSVGQDYSENFDAEDPSVVFLRDTGLGKNIGARAFRNKEMWK